MTDEEFDTLDELYFLQSYNDLKKLVNIQEEKLKDVLAGLLKKGWLRCYVNPNDEIDYNEVKFQKEYRNYYYLASKEGLLAHNSNF